MAEPPSVGCGESNNRLLEEENLAFYRARRGRRSVVDDDVVELLS
jgi:hypothetical protein